MRRLLIVNPEFMLPANTGGRLRTWRFVEALRHRFELNLIHPYRHAHQLERLDEAKPWFANIWSVDVGCGPTMVDDSPGARLARLLRREPWELTYEHFPAFAGALRATLAAHDFDVILARYIYQARYLFEMPRPPRARIVVDLDDIEPLKIERARRLAAAPRHAYTRARLQLNHAAFRRYHRRHLPAADLCTVCSEQDRAYLSDERWSPNVAIIPNTIDMDRYACGEADLEQQTLLFCGTLSYQPNVDGLLWFVREVWPHLKQLHPSVKLSIVGRGAGQDILALGRDPSIFVHPDVPAVQAFYEGAAVVVVPIRVGGGTRIKILEAAACRRPVVSTSIGAEGLQVESGRHCLIADDPVAFARSCSELLRNPPLARRLVSEHYRLVESSYDTPVVFRQIQRLFEFTDGCDVPAHVHCAA